MEKNKNRKRLNINAIDKVVAHRFWGIIVLLIMMWLMFYATFSLGAYPVRLIEYGFEQLTLLLMHLPDNLFRSLLIDGIVHGVGGVVAFLPNVLILFFCITIFEESNYIHRAMLVTDKLMHAIGLHGDSFLPLVMGFGCNVPALMATQALHDKHQRWLTILLIPFMSCNARVPVFVLLISAFFSQYAATVLFILYLIGISVAAISGLIFSLFFFKRREPVVEITLTPYRVPQLRPTLKKMWAEASDYLKKITNVVLAASAIIWALNTFPLNKEGATEHESYLEQAGKFLSPVFAPLGFDWKMTTALITGVVAKETVVSTLSVLYTGEDEETLLGERLQNESIFSTSTVAAFLIFILLYFPCIAAVTCIYKVTKSVGFTLLSVCYTTGIAWILAFLTQKISVLFL